MDRIGMDEEYAGRTYDDFIDYIYEDGRMPSVEGMEAFWEIGIEAGDYEEAWEDDRYLDATFMDSFEEWKPEE
jgi:NitT/TauT family transport system substrate-binding protein